MNKEQIEKISEIIASKTCPAYDPHCEEWVPHNCGKCYANSTQINDVAEAIYEAGYHHQSEVAAVIIDEFDHLVTSYVKDRDLYLVVFKNAIQYAREILAQKYITQTTNT